MAVIAKEEGKVSIPGFPFESMANNREIGIARFEGSSTICIISGYTVKGVRCQKVITLNRRSLFVHLTRSTRKVVGAFPLPLLLFLILLSID